MNLEALKEDVSQLKKDVLKIGVDLGWIKKIGSIVSGSIIAIFIKVMFF